MRTFDVQFLESFDRARLVIEIYWNHTTGDPGAGTRRVSVENLRKSVEKLIGLPVNFIGVDYSNEFLRGNMERYDDRIDIHVLLPQSEEWQRFTAVKELCHALCDQADEWSDDPIPLIEDIVELETISNDTPAGTRAERFAEMVALELLYPFEFRRKDRERVAAAETTTATIAAEFGIPVRYVEIAQTEAWLDYCETVWRFVTRTVPHEGDPGFGAE